MRRAIVMQALAVAILVWLAYGPVCGATYSVRSLGVVSGYDGSFARAISDDGVALCSAISATDTTGVFTWSCSSGLVDLSGQGVQASGGINHEGQTVGLHKDDTTGYYLPYIRNSDGTTSSLPVPAGAAGSCPAGTFGYGCFRLSCRSSIEGSG